MTKAKGQSIIEGQIEERQKKVGKKRSMSKALTERIAHRLEGSLRTYGQKVASELECRTGRLKEAVFIKCSRVVSVKGRKRYIRFLI